VVRWILGGVTLLVFFQSTLLAGYVCRLTKRLGVRHSCCMSAAVAALTRVILASPDWKPRATGADPAHPAAAVVTIGLPSSSRATPLLQACYWRRFTRSHRCALNFASLLAPLGFRCCHRLAC
jgi:hypothetical protein